MTINEQQYLKNTYFDKAEVLKEWDSVRLPILEKLKKEDKDIKLRIKKGR